MVIFSTVPSHPPPTPDDLFLFSTISPLNFYVLLFHFVGMYRVCVGSHSYCGFMTVTARSCSANSTSQPHPLLQQSCGLQGQRGYPAEGQALYCHLFSVLGQLWICINHFPLQTATSLIHTESRINLET